MKELLEDYKRKLKTVERVIIELRFKDDANPNYIRLKTKQYCYRAFINELERELKNN